MQTVANESGKSTAMFIFDMIEQKRVVCIQHKCQTTDTQNEIEIQNMCITSVITVSYTFCCEYFVILDLYMYIYVSVDKTAAKQYGYIVQITVEAARTFEIVQKYLQLHIRMLTFHVHCTPNAE